MKKLLVCLLAGLLIGCVSTGKRDTTSDLERLAEGAKGKWSDYGDYSAAEILDADNLPVDEYPVDAPQPSQGLRQNI